ncbi:non-canonical purine NTP diphosphatase [Aquimarina intermedia]|uniref:dITP/XTP pyrophosphatase n=1 Tax=Aquimarina intermedia TaxID=350814 RepID=A0A5S5C6R9_9FLAO|nr:non-canonical purine NTP diphosphatase [Aquimarina intermedia]TYP74298.1 XTP/dITP diphosphohydrolase [Aquimarina intermedia]
MKIVFATNNPNKLKDIQSIVPDSITIVSLKDIGCDEDIPETSPTIEENAVQKATYVKEQYGYDCFADDTGLEIIALNNEPGVYSARYAGSARDSKANIAKVLTNLNSISDRSARFKTVIALQLGETTHTFTGICEGSINQDPKGDQGFGYDPIFIPKGYKETFAELPASLKNKISHRAKAMQKLLTFIEEDLS